MFKMTRKDWIINTETKKQADLKAESRISHQPEAIIGLGMMGVGLICTIFGAWKAGLNDFDRAEYEALKEAGCIKE